MKFLFHNPLKTLLVWAILYRTIIVFFYQHISIFPDSEGYVTLARLLSDCNLSGYEGMRSPGYPLLLTLLNNNQYLLIGLQLIIGVANSLIVYRNLMLLKFSSRSAFIIAVLLDLLLHVVFYETSILTESLTLFFTSLIFNALLKDYFKKKVVKRDLLMAFLLSYLVFIKPFYIFLPFLIYGFFILKNFNFGIFRSSKIIIVIFPLLTFLGWSYANKINTGYFVPTTFYGYNLSQNCVYFAEKAPPEYQQISKIYVHHRQKTIREGGNVAMTIWAAYNDLRKETGLSFVDLSFKLNQFSTTLIKNNPADYLKQVALSWNDFWKTDINWNASEFKSKKSAPVFTWIWNMQHYFLRIFKIAFVFNIVLLLFSFFKDRHFSPEIIITTIIVTTSLLQAFSTYGTNSRFSYPFEFMMVIVVLMQIKKIYGLRKKSI